MTFAHITEQGRALLDDIFPDHAKEIHEMISVLSEEEKDARIDMLKHVGLRAKHLYDHKE